ncbi:MAG: carbohydrate-binding protein [Dysgonamonadaceae bacterium]|jgi:hypothetical protein|nr:carbohydrate-binding protein [Dysgonamonadaceae bacterium]
MRNFYSFFILCLLTSCSANYSPEIEFVLQQSGNNRGELENVLKHYSQNPADSLKLRAAEFLIINMPGKYSEYYDAPWNDVATVLLRWTSSSNKQLVLDTYRLGAPVIKEDVKYVTAEYLINNIELAFKVWQERPWGKHIPFDAFCEEILPYRLSSEPLENWREKALASFADLDTILNKPETTAVEACRIVNDLLPRFRIDWDFPAMNYSQLMASAKGPCDNAAALAVFSMRALGIPVSFDFIHRWPNLTHGHAWNCVRDSTGKHISFMGAEVNPGGAHMGITKLKNKVYRKTFAGHTFRMDKKYIPPLFHGNITDVSCEYEGIYDVEIPVKYLPDSVTGYAWLAGRHASKWEIDGWGTTDGTTIHFASVGGQVLYLPVWYENGTMKAAGDMFRLDNDGNVIFITEGPKPFKGPHILSAAAPCIIPMRDFDIGGEGVAFHESDEQNQNGYDEDDYRRSHGDPSSYSVDIVERQCIGWTVTGEWLIYTVEVTDPGEYQLSVSASALTTTSTFHLEVDNQDVSGSVSIPNTGDWLQWVWCPAEPLKVYLTAGSHQIKFYYEAGGSNLHELKLTYIRNRAGENKSLKIN